MTKQSPTKKPGLLEILAKGWSNWHLRLLKVIKKLEKIFMSNIEKARRARRPELVFDGTDYTISKIPLNYRIYIKSDLEKKIPNRAIDRDCYSDLDSGIEKAHTTARECIEEYFVTTG